MDDLEEKELMIAYQKGDFNAFERLYRHISPRIYGYLKARLNRPEERDEVFQQIFLKLHKSRALYSSNYSFTQWIFVISRSVLFDYLRKKKRTPELLNLEDQQELEKKPLRVSQEGYGQAYSGVEALGGLTEEQKSILSWRIIDELSYEEIASKLGRSQESVRQILSRVLRKLKAVSVFKASK